MDDMIVVVNGKHYISTFKAWLIGESNIKDLKAINQILGTRILQERKLG